MSAPVSSRPTEDRNLLFGVLALQMDFITRDALVAAMNAWVLQKSAPLGEILLDQGALRPDAHALLDALVRSGVWSGMSKTSSSGSWFYWGGKLKRASTRMAASCGQAVTHAGR
jgi:hypothetical protein